MEKESGKVDLRINRRKFAGRLRRLIDEVVESEVHDDVFFDMLEPIEKCIQILSGGARRINVIYGESYAKLRWEENRFHFGELIDFSPVSGKSNPVAPPVTVFSDDKKKVKGKVNFPVSFEGPPGLVHGGYVCAAFDEFLGLAQSITGDPGMTGTLKVRFINPCPLRTDIQMEGCVSRLEGRKKYVTGTMHVENIKIAEAEGIFVIPVEKNKPPSFQ